MENFLFFDEKFQTLRTLTIISCYSSCFWLPIPLGLVLRWFVFCLMIGNNTLISAILSPVFLCVAVLKRFFFEKFPDFEYKFFRYAKYKRFLLVEASLACLLYVVAFVCCQLIAHTCRV